MISEEQFLRVLKSRMQQYVNRLATGKDTVQIQLDQLFKKFKTSIAKLKLPEKEFWGYFFDRTYDGSQKLNNDSIDRIKGHIDINNIRQTNFYITIFYYQDGYLNFRYYLLDIIFGIYNSSPLKPFSIPIDKVRMIPNFNNDPFLLLEFDDMSLDKAAMLANKNDIEYYVNKLKEIKAKPATSKSVNINVNSINEAVERGINDIQLIYSKNGAVNAFDRMHSVLHGVLKIICKNDGIILTPEEEQKMTSLYKRLKQEHTVLKQNENGNEAAGIVIQSLSSIIDRINSLRNNSSLAHPNENILDEEEAELIFQTGIAVLHYLDKKVSQ